MLMSTEERNNSTIDMEDVRMRINIPRQRFPYCIVWTPIPLLTWLFPFIGHMGIAYSSGVIRDFAGPYYVSEGDMAFGAPTRYLQFNPMKVNRQDWDQSISTASDEYKTRMHNLCCDNCHSHVAMALNLMEYGASSNWNMIKLAAQMFVFGKYVNCYAVIKTWLPFFLLVGIFATVGIYLSL